MPDDVNLGSGLIGQFLQSAIGDGLSMTAARDLFRESGVGALSNQTFSQLYGEARFAAGKYDDWANLDYSAVPGAEQYADIRASGPDRYLTRVEVGVREIGQRDITTTFFTHMTNDPHSPQEAIDAATSRIADTQQYGVTLGQGAVLAAWVSGIFRTKAP